MNHFGIGIESSQFTPIMSTGPIHGTAIPVIDFIPVYGLAFHCSSPAVKLLRVIDHFIHMMAGTQSNVLQRNFQRQGSGSAESGADYR